MVGEINEPDSDGIGRATYAYGSHGQAPRDERWMRVLVLSSLFPSRTRPTFGVFVKERLRYLVPDCELVVVAPIPWFPGNRWIRGKAYTKTPLVERDDAGLLVYHPRFVSIPRIGKMLDGALYALCILPLLMWLRLRFRFDVVDAEFGYPDGVAAVLSGWWFGCGVTITLRGDEARIARHSWKWRQLRWALAQARVIAVSDALRQIAAGFDVNPDAVRVIPNGIDTSHFHPSDRRAARERLGLAQDGVILLAVGSLEERKGHHRAVDALRNLLHERSDLLYVAIGDAVRGDAGLAMLEKVVSQHGLHQQVRVVPSRPHEEIPYWLAAADVFCLATNLEGRSNAIMEALACGLPVVSTLVGGTAEVVRDGEDGFLVAYWDPNAFAAAIRAALARDWNRNALALRAQAWRWEETARMLVDELRAASEAATRNR